MWRDNNWEAAVFFSRQTRGPERSYSAMELEALALVEAVRHFAYYLYGKPFIVFSDHKPLCALLSSDRLNGRLKQIGMKLQHWLIQIKYLPGVENGSADALSREEWKSETGSQDASLASGGVRDQPSQEKRKDRKNTQAGN